MLDVIFILLKVILFDFLDFLFIFLWNFIKLFFSRDSLLYLGMIGLGNKWLKKDVCFKLIGYEIFGDLNNGFEK